MNEILLNYSGSTFNVDFTDVPLNEVKFQDFGDKIRGLRVTSCHTMTYEEEQQVLVDVFTRTPNLTYFRYYDLDQYDAWYTWLNRSMFPDIIIELHRRNFKFNDLRHFDTTAEFSHLSELYEIFPRLQSLRSVAMCLFQMSYHSLPFKDDLTEIGKIRVPVRTLHSSKNQQNFLLSLPKFVHTFCRSKLPYPDGRPY